MGRKARAKPAPAAVVLPPPSRPRQCRTCDKRYTKARTPTTCIDCGYHTCPDCTKAMVQCGGCKKPVGIDNETMNALMRGRVSAQSLIGQIFKQEKQSPESFSVSFSDLAFPHEVAYWLNRVLMSSTPHDRNWEVRLRNALDLDTMTNSQIVVVSLGPTPRPRTSK